MCQPGQIWTNWAERGGLPGVDDDGNGFVDDTWGWDVDPLSGGPRLVGHVEAQNGVGPGLHDLCEQDQVPFQLRGVGDDHHHVGRVGQLVLRDPLVGGKRAEAVGPRQIDDVQSELVDVAAAGAALDRHPRIVRDVLARPGEGIEQRGLAAIRVPRQGDTDFCRGLNV